ncbi:hypothetical protein [Xanthomonas maliensis]|uniref:hypothetical protein n=1 Tax=Xanthomonas maliensis TaxID=1321368 RepID=UPI0003A61EF3|nr:hypothetical protein [Xanthomonas maliensis]KAB7768148.1 hypothetical protein CKY51_09780 [Xanthomonas maliensis]
MLRQFMPEAFIADDARQVDAASLALLYRAVAAAQATQPNDEGLERQLQILALLRVRGQATANQLNDAGDALLHAHRIEEARQRLAEGSHPEWLAWLRFDDHLGAGEHGPTLWTLDDSGTVMQRRAIDLGPTQILVTAGRHFSADAARAIAAAPALGPVFRRHALWLTPPPSSEDITALRSWNRSHPHIPLHPLYDAAEWPLLPHPWVMPTFLLVRDGQVRAQLQGWPTDDRAQLRALKSMLRAAGLLTQPQHTPRA